MATRSPGRTPRPSRPARSLPAASETSVHEWSVQTLSRLSLRNARAPNFCACASKDCDSVATRSGIRDRDLLFHDPVVAQRLVAANRVTTAPCRSGYRRKRDGSLWSVSELLEAVNFWFKELQ